MSEIKKKTINGLVWSFLESFSFQIIQFIVGIILARILSPKEFGLIGMITIFISISQSLIDSGFSNALIRKKECTSIDYNTVFVFNLFVGLFIYSILYFSSGAVSTFFREPKLEILLKVVSLVLIFSAISIIQQTILIKNVDFKTQTKISFASAVLSGVISIILANLGFGVWSLVALTLFRQVTSSILLWIIIDWRPKIEFEINTFKELYGFGSKLLISGLIDTIYINSFYFIIGKFYSSTALGFFTRANQFKSVLADNMSSIINRVSYPIFSELQYDNEILKTSYLKLIRSSMLLSCLLMLGLASVSEAMILTLIGEKWLSAVPYLQLLCFVGILNPFHAINLNLLKIKGRSDLFLKLEVIKKILAIPTIIIGIYFGIKFMILGMIVNSIIALFLNSYWTGKFINYSIKSQIYDILPGFIFSILVISPSFIFKVLVNLSPSNMLFSQLLISLSMLLIVGELKINADYIYLKHTVLKYFNRKNLRANEIN